MKAEEILQSFLKYANANMGYPGLSNPIQTPPAPPSAAIPASTAAPLSGGTSQAGSTSPSGVTALKYVGPPPKQAPANIQGDVTGKTNGNTTSKSVKPLTNTSKGIKI